MASLAPGTAPRADPAATPARLTPYTTRPATVDAVWLPCPAVSTGDRPARPCLYARAPMILLHARARQHVSANKHWGTRHDEQRCM